ncbi:MAG: hypothetical protein JXA10_01930 [Anaerolineae bacterium]|nr:hypothetical protein [Anaerolineae bacterium]
MQDGIYISGARATMLSDRLRENHPIAEPHPDMWRSLIAHYDVPYTFQDVWQWRRD